VIDELRFDGDGLIPAVAQESSTGEVLMVAWMDRAALEATRRTGLAHYWSRSRQALWQKGESSGHRQHVEGIYADCDRDTLLLLVHQEGVACHTGARTCFFTRIQEKGATEKQPAEVAGPAILEVVERVIQSRKVEPAPGSYVSALLAKGEPAICRKVGEESAEVVTAALGGEGDARLVEEVADLWFHTMVLLGGRGIPLRRLFQELARRRSSPTPPLAPRAPAPAPRPDEGSS
jgi:phosphoribosyl-ATP pyrophosphohydrolase/phosphoribosyl-AMP cyclohydrolase